MELDGGDDYDKDNLNSSIGIGAGCALGCMVFVVILCFGLAVLLLKVFA